jgi:hypothetical protein
LIEESRAQYPIAPGADNHYIFQQPLVFELEWQFIAIEFFKKLNLFMCGNLQITIHPIIAFISRRIGIAVRFYSPSFKVTWKNPE